MTYERCWTWVVCLAVATGPGLALLAWGPLRSGLTLCGVTAAIFVTRILVSSGHADPRALVSRTSLASSAGVGCALVAGVCFLQVLPSLTLATGLLFGAGSPRLWRAVRARRPEPEPVAEPTADLVARPVDPLSDDEVAALSDDGLCQAWRRAFLRVSSVGRPDVLGAVATTRRKILDELERRVVRP